MELEEATPTREKYSDRGEERRSGLVVGNNVGSLVVGGVFLSQISKNSPPTANQVAKMCGNPEIGTGRLIRTVACETLFQTVTK